MSWQYSNDVDPRLLSVRTVPSVIVECLKIENQTKSAKFSVQICPNLQNRLSVVACNVVWERESIVKTGDITVVYVVVTNN